MINKNVKDEYNQAILSLHTPFANIGNSLGAKKT